MRAITGAFASLLSLMMVLTSSSASVCDISCWLRQPSADCRCTMSAFVGQVMDMTMPMPGMDMSASTGDANRTMNSNMPGMNMDAPHRQSPMAPRLQVPLKHFMQLQMDIAIERFSNTSVLIPATGAHHNYSESLSDCRHGLCAQHAVSASLPSSSVSQAHFAQLVELETANPADSLTAIYCLTPTTLPPKALSIRQLSGTLRI